MEVLMPHHEPLFHMDADYDWRWYIVDSRNKLVAMSANSFFKFEDAKRDFEKACPIFDQVS
jgi:hypothetical protein